MLHDLVPPYLTMYNTVTFDSSHVGTWTFRPYFKVNGVTTTATTQSYTVTVTAG